MNLNKPYNRTEFISFLERSFLPDDLLLVEEKLSIDDFKTQFCKDAYKLGSSKSMGLDVYEITHTSTHDARVGISKDAFQILLRKSYNNRALVLFVPEGSKQYRFSLIQIEAELNDLTSRIKRSYSNPRRYSFLLGEGAHIKTPNQFLLEKGKLKPKDGDYFPDLSDRFSVEVLTKEFYKELFKWYEWANSDFDGFAVTFPNDTSTDSDDRKIDKHIIRLITRLMFVWFIKQKKLVPQKIFNKEDLTNILVDFDPTSKTTGNYYNAVLQNLFFATLNKKISDREFAKNGSFIKQKEHFGIKTLFRDANEKSWFKLSHNEIIDLFNEVPFMNGGLFECLDKTENGKTMYYDGFSRAVGRQKRAFLPNCLFFDPEKGIISILEKYNFTVEENTPRDVEVALDPELLGKVFENLLGAFNEETKDTARKQSGSFYTPREIVNYMVDESIIAYLNHTCSEISEDTIRLLFKDDILLDEIELTPESRSRLIEALKLVKMLDPACGSGAFPMGMLNRMLYLLKKLQPVATTNDYDLKLHLIENCIYGVDIQTIAVQISKLRFFISLICEQEKDPKKDNFGIVALPNLETKFVAANTLIGLKKDFSEKLDLQNEELNALKIQLLDVRHKHFLAPNAHEKHKLRELDEQLRNRIKTFLIDNSTKPNTYKIKLLNEKIAELNKQKKQFVGEKWEDTSIMPQQQATLDFGFEPVPELQPSIFRVDVNKQKRNELDLQIKRIENDIIREESKSKNDAFEDEADKLSHWNPYDQNTSSMFFDAEWMFGIKDGFDMVIGNPPYIDSKKLKSISNDLKQNFETYTGSSDIYVFFYEAGFRVLNSYGVLSFITSNKWIRSEYGRNLRKLLLEKINPLQLLDFGTNRVFDATVDCNILIAQKTFNKNELRVCNVSDKLQGSGIYEYFTKNYLSNIELTDNPWLINLGYNNQLKSKIEAIGFPLNEFGINIYRGILTGLNEAFIIDGNRKMEFQSKGVSSSLFEPIIKGKNIDKYIYNFDDSWLINSHNGNREKKISPVNVKEDYFPIYQWFESFLPAIINRTDKGIHWSNLRNCAYLGEFKKEKILYQGIAKRIVFSYDSKGVFCDVTTFFMTGKNLKYILAILNSRFFEYILLNVYLEGDTFKSKNQILQQFPFPKADIYQEKLILTYIDQILSSKQANSQSDTTALERKIDELVYKLYDLTYEEVQVVEEGKFWLSEEEYGKIEV